MGKDMESVQFRDANDLYTNLSVDHVWLVLNSTKEQVDTKRNELRELISLRYHDLIDSADAIVGMDQTVDEFKHLVANIEKNAKGLVDGYSNLLGGETVGGMQPLSKFGSELSMEDSEDMQWLSQLEKADILSQAAVNIWESIDSKELWTACEIYLDAKSAYKHLQISSPVSQGQGSFKNDRLPLIDEESLALLDLDAASFSGKGNSFPSGTSNSMNVGSKNRSIWNLYPYLKSQWQQVEQAREKILLEATLILKSEEMNLESTGGAIRALIVLGQVTAAESISRLLEARRSLVHETLTKATNAEALVRSLAIMIHTIANCGQLFGVQGSSKIGDAATVDLDFARQQVSQWVRLLLPDFSSRGKVLLEKVDDIEDLRDLQMQLNDVEQNGGVPSDTISDLDAQSWRSIYESFVESSLWQNTDPCTFLFKFLLQDAFTNRAVHLLEESFRAVCTSFQANLTQTISTQSLEPTMDISSPESNWFTSASRPSASSTANSDEDNDVEDSDEEDEGVVLGPRELDARTFKLLSSMVLSEDAVDRARAAIFLLQEFNAQLFNLHSVISQFVGKGSNQPRSNSLLSTLETRCELVLNELVSSMRSRLELTLAGFQQSVSRLLSKEDGQQQFELMAPNDKKEQDDSDNFLSPLKHSLFLCRVSQGLVASKGNLSVFLSNDALQTFFKQLEDMSKSCHTIFAESSLSMSRGVLEESLQAQDWAFARDWKILYGGWERISINIIRGGSTDPLDDADFEEDNVDGDLDEAIHLPGAVSSGVAMFSFLLSKQIRLLGDSKFISSPSVLALSISPGGVVKYGTITGKPVGKGSQEGGMEPWLEPFLSDAANAFCVASQEAILLLADAGLAIVAEIYAAHIEQHSESPNEEAALQTIFDLYWFEWLLYVRDRPKENVLQNLIDTLIESDHIDIVNWSLYDQFLLKRVKTYRERNSLLFGPTLTVKAFYERTAASKPSLIPLPSVSFEGASAYDCNNMLNLGYLANSTVSRIPLLPIPTFARSANQKRSTLEKKRSSSSSITLLESPTALSASGRNLSNKDSSSKIQEDASAALRVMGQVGSTFFSQASSWFNKPSEK